MTAQISATTNSEKKIFPQRREGAKFGKEVNGFSPSIS